MVKLRNRSIQSLEYYSWRVNGEIHTAWSQIQLLLFPAAGMGERLRARLRTISARGAKIYKRRRT
jgi:hypothetical protein